MVIRTNGHPIYRDADDAVYDLHGKELLGYKVTVEHAKGFNQPINLSSRLYIYGIV